MPSAFELMMQGGLSDADKQKMIASQLRNRRQTGELAILSGDRVLAPLGQGIYQDAANQENQALNLRADETTAGEGARRFALQQAMAARQQDETERHNLETEANARIAAERARAGVQNQFDNNVRRYSETMTRLGIPELKRDVLEVDSLLGKYKGKDIPGMGATAWVHDSLLSNEGVQVRQAVARVRNKLLKIRSGAAVTDPEMARLAEELGAKLGGTDREIMLAWPEIVDGLKTIESGIASGYDPEVVATFEERFANRKGSDPEVPGAARVDRRTVPDPTGQGEGSRVIDWGSM